MKYFTYRNTMLNYFNFFSGNLVYIPKEFYSPVAHHNNFGSFFSKFLNYNSLNICRVFYDCVKCNYNISCQRKVIFPFSNSFPGFKRKEEAIEQYKSCYHVRVFSISNSIFIKQRLTETCKKKHQAQVWEVSISICKNDTPRWKYREIYRNC